MRHFLFHSSGGKKHDLNEKAYRKGYEASKTQSDTANPYRYTVRSESLMLWWDTGFQDHQLGRRHRFESKAEGDMG